MIKVWKSCLLMVIFTFLFLFVNVSAKEESYYTNYNGVQMNEEEYNLMVSMFSEDRIEILSQQEFDKYKNCSVVSKKEIFQKETYENGELIRVEPITKQEYLNSSDKKVNGLRSGDDGFIETSYKRFDAAVVDVGSYYLLDLDLTWKQVPYCRSYDVFAFRTTHMSYSSVIGIQTYFVGNAYTNISYNSSSQGYNGLSNGAGISMNLKDDTNITKFIMSLNANLSISDYNSTYAHIFTTYQHAQNDLTRSQSMSYTLQAGGLGDVVYYSNSTIRNKYDGMSGIELLVAI